MKLPNFQSAGLGGSVVDDINSRISRLATTAKPQEAFLYANLTDFQNSQQRKDMLTAQRYYDNKNDICERERYYIDRKGNKQKAENLANSKLTHPYMRKLVNQKVNYLLSKEFSVNCDDDTFLELLGQWFDKDFHKMLKNVGKEAITKAIAWVQPYYDKNGELKFKRIPSEEIRAFWADADHTILEGVLRFYVIKEYQENGTVKDITKVEYHTAEGAWYYVVGESGLVPDEEKGEGIQGHFFVAQQVLTEDGKPQLDEQGKEVYADVPAIWDRIPFIPFRYNSDEISLLQWVKPLIDDYDLSTSDNSNNLQDVPNSIKVVKNYDGTDKGEFVQNLATFRTAFVSGDGDMHAVDTPFNTEATEAHLTRLRKDIYEAGCGVDTQEADLGNASGVALKFRYADLDMDTDDMANEFAASLETLIWFIKVDLLNKGQGDFMEVDYDIIFNTDMIINETETITQAKESSGIVSDETILANHPWVTDVAEEQKKLKKQQQEALKTMQDALEVQNGFGSQNQANNSDSTATNQNQNANANGNGTGDSNAE